MTNFVTAMSSGTRAKLLIHLQDLLQEEGDNTIQCKFQVEKTLDSNEKSGIITVHSPSKFSSGIDLTQPA